MKWLAYKRIRVYSDPIDFRKQMNGIIQVIHEEEGEAPQKECVYVFRNKQSNKLKLLVWDRNGYFLGYKRLDKGRFDFPVSQDGGVSLTKEEFFELVSGMPMVHIKAIKKELFYH
ncbi:IS66 family insertion sequence element accessory protein TnpB [bacterium]|jgi:transposase|nr:IS66 family insertion sequence element accessory protein TnpB [bacterium]